MRHSRRDAPELTVGVRQDVPGRAEASQGSLVVGLRLPFGTDDRCRPSLCENPLSPRLTDP
jgi:outer membrane protein, heavy metal efflux system